MLHAFLTNFWLVSLHFLLITFFLFIILQSSMHIEIKKNNFVYLWLNFSKKKKNK